ncbi:MAG: N-formylglutamate amidohydrolase [Pseudomonadota bacterium]
MRFSRKNSDKSPSYSGGWSDLDKVSGGSVCDNAHGPAFTYVAPRSMPMPVLIAVPHAGRRYPSETLANMRGEGMCQLRLEDRYVDKLGVEIAKLTGTGLLVAHAPRALLDLNRSQEDVDWDMIEGSPKPAQRHSSANRRARSGLGLIPRRLPGFGEIWRERLPREDLDARIEQIHRPYHDFLGRELERIRDAWGAALLVDLHSMPPLRPQTGQDRSPEIVLGDRFGASCHGKLVARAFRYLDAQGRPNAHNRPYSGGYVLDRHASPRRGVHAVQVEVCRSAYLDNRLSEPSTNLVPLAKMLAGMVRELGAEVARLGTGGQLPQAAE